MHVTYRFREAVNQRHTGVACKEELVQVFQVLCLELVLPQQKFTRQPIKYSAKLDTICVLVLHAYDPQRPQKARN